MTEFTINRKYWMNKDNPKWDNTLQFNNLVNDDGSMCCMGFFCNRISRIPKEELLNIGVPSELFLETKPTIASLEKYEDILLQLNDIRDFVKKFDREKAIKKVFKKMGYEVKFTGSYEKRS